MRNQTNDNLFEPGKSIKIWWRAEENEIENIYIIEVVVSFK